MYTILYYPVYGMKSQGAITIQRKRDCSVMNCDIAPDRYGFSKNTSCWSPEDRIFLNFYKEIPEEAAIYCSTLPHCGGFQMNKEETRIEFFKEYSGCETNHNWNTWNKVGSKYLLEVVNNECPNTCSYTTPCSSIHNNMENECISYKRNKVYHDRFFNTLTEVLSVGDNEEDDNDCGLAKCPTDLNSDDNENFVGEYCEGDGQAGTDNFLNNCNFIFDVYKIINNPDWTDDMDMMESSHTILQNEHKSKDKKIISQNLLQDEQKNDFEQPQSNNSIDNRRSDMFIIIASSFLTLSVIFVCLCMGGLVYYCSKIKNKGNNNNTATDNYDIMMNSNNN